MGVEITGLIKEKTKEDEVYLASESSALSDETSSA